MVSEARRRVVRLGEDGPPLRAIVFDFDGVILESAEIKEHAFVELFADHPEHAEDIRRHHLENQGISRYDKFAWVHRELLGREIAPDESMTLSERFSELVLEQTLSCPMVPGALELLEELLEECLAFVASGTPQEELTFIVNRRGLSDYFTEVHGSPTSKEEILKGIADRYTLTYRELVMVGDSASDHGAARSVGIPFVLRETRAQQAYLGNLSLPRVRDLSELSALLGLCSKRSGRRAQLTYASR